MKLVASVSELGLLASLASSRARLAVASAAALAASVVYGVLVADHIVWESTSVGANILLITGQFFFVLFAAYVHAMLLGALMFGERWRRRVLCGERFADAEGGGTEAEEELLQIDRFKDNTLPFYGLFVVLLAANWLAVQVGAGNYVSEYHEKGYHLTLMRSDDAQARAHAVRSLLDPMNRSTANDPDIRARVLELLDDPVPGVQLWAVWATGHLEIVRGHARLIALLDQTEGPLRVEVIEAIGRLRLAGQEGERRLLAMLPLTIGDDRTARAVLHGLGFLQNAESAGPVLSLMGILPEDLEVVALWALGRMRTTTPREVVLQRWHEEDDLRMRCALAEALKHVTVLEDEPMLRELFVTVPVDLHCEEERWEGLSYDDDERFRPVIYVVRESLRMKIFKAIFNIGAPGLREWLVDVAWDSDQPADIRVLADQLAERLRTGPIRPPREP